MYAYVRILISAALFSYAFYMLSFIFFNNEKEESGSKVMQAKEENIESVDYQNFEPDRKVMSKNKWEQNLLNMRNKATKKKLPGVVIIGIKKCGSGALIEIMKMHPRLVAPPYFSVEVKFWADDHLFKKGLDYYKVGKGLLDKVISTNHVFFYQIRYVKI